MVFPTKSSLFSTGHENTVSVLLKHDANQFLKDKNGVDAFKMAQELNDDSPSRKNIYDMLSFC